MKKMYKLLAGLTSIVAVQSYNAQCPTPTSVTATPSVICAGATTSLNATAVGSSINWYTVGVGGTPLGSSASGSNFPIAATATTYYAESFAVGTLTFNYTGAVQSYTIPVGVTQITVDMKGAQGGGGNIPGGLGGRVQATYTVVPGSVLNIYVGGAGGNYVNTVTNALGGFNGGGTGFATGNNAYQNTGGGGATDIRLNGITLADRVIVAGGGGGKGDDGCTANDLVPGAGGGLTGGAGAAGGMCSCNPSGQGGTPSAGGVRGDWGCTCNAVNGSLGLGGNSNSTSCGGPTGGGAGGGGYYGGGGGGLGAGGGGSSYTDPGATNVIHTQGFQTGDGQVIITVPSCFSAQRTPVTITINPLPTITVNSGSICLGNSFTIVPSGAATYTYEGGNAVVSPTTNTNYTVVGTSSAGCISQSFVTSSVTINISPLPTIAVNSGSICSGSSFTMIATGANTYTFQGGNAVVSPTANATYTVVGTNSVGCVSSTFATSSISVTAAPSVTIAGSSSLCLGQSATLTASGADSYSWNTGANTSSISISPTVTTVYTAYGTSSVTGCVGTKTMSLLVTTCAGLSAVQSELKGLTVYPNPTENILSIELNNGNAKSIVITDLIGRVVLTENTSNDKIDLNIASLTNGVYFVKIQSNGATEIFKVVKQ